EECEDMRAHVPAVGQQSHGVGHQTGRDLDDHHRGSDADHDARTPFRVRKIRHEIVSLTETGMINPMHY
ncbi:MAG: hypothetical protein WA269_11245, partial [Candidatus Udaeobacter sp.]